MGREQSREERKKDFLAQAEEMYEKLEDRYDKHLFCFINTVYPLLLQTTNTWGKAAAKHSKGGKVNFGITMCVSVMFF